MKKTLEWISANDRLIIRILLQIAALTAGYCTVNFDPDVVTLVLTAAGMLVVTGYNIWKNFSVTDEAKQSDKVLDAIRKGLVRTEDILRCIEEQPQGKSK